VADWLHAGRIGRPHGLDGSFHVTRPRWLLLEPGATVRVGELDLEVERRAGTEDRPIVRLAAVSSRAQLDPLRGADLLVQRVAAPALPEGEFWAEELEGCAVVDGAIEVGVVVALVELPSCEALQVRRPAGEELLVPMVADAVREIDTTRRHVDVDLGFLGMGA
jgi:16S rRNA processing protein RimM